VYLRVPSIVKVNCIELADADVDLVLYCGLLNAIFAIVYFFVPNIIASSTSKKKPSTISFGKSSKS